MRGVRGRLIRSLLAAMAWGCAVRAGAGEGVGVEAAIKPPAPSTARLYPAGSGRFDVVAEPGEDARALARLAEAAWPAWRGSLGLPDRMPIAITVRLTPPERWGGGDGGWRVSVEPGGVTTVWIRGGGEPDVARERRWLTALAEGALRRRAVLLGAGADAAAPRWLAAGAAEDVLIKTRPAMQDAWRQATERAGVAPSLREVFAWDGAAEEAVADRLGAAAYGVWQWLQVESGRTQAWERLVAAILTGKSSGLALVESYPERFARSSAADIELAWSVGAAGLARVRAVPLMEAAESRRWLEQADRVVLRLVGEERERAVSLSDLWAGRGDAFIEAQRQARLSRITTTMARVHPFYRNAAGSLGRVYLAQAEGRQREWTAALAEWRNDLALGRELEQSSAALLDAVAR